MNVEELARLEEAGTLPELLLFWGHRPPKGGGVGQGWLSQWYPASSTAGGVRYATAEHFMMAGKTRLFGDDEAERRVLASDDPGKAKGAGRQVRGFDEDTWAAHRYDLVVAANTAKFEQHPPLRSYLLGTGERAWSRPARTTRSGASACPRRSRRHGTRHSGAASTCSASL